jgi:hypothetical protein
VIKDYELLHAVGADPTVSESQHIAAHKEGVVKRCREWLRRGTGAGKEEGWRPRKKRRVKSSSWVSAVDAQLRLASDHALNLDVLVQPADKKRRKSAFEWPSATCTMDQGPDGLCAMNWLWRECGANFDAVYDFSHLVSNSWKGGLNQSGMMAFHRLMVVAWNARHGPWEEGVRWGQATDVMRTHCELMDLQDCPLFTDLLPRILEDQGRAVLAHMQ